MPQFRQNVSASASRMIRQASTCSEATRGGTRLMDAKRLPLHDISTHARVCSRRPSLPATRQSLDFSSLKQHAAAYLLPRRAAAAHVQLRAAGQHHDAVVVGAACGALLVRLDLSGLRQGGKRVGWGCWELLQAELPSPAAKPA